MSAPLVVEIPHRLGKDEAIRRLKAGLGRVSAQYGSMAQVHEEIWSGDRLSFRVEWRRLLLCLVAGKNKAACARLRKSRFALRLMLWAD